MKRLCKDVDITDRGLISRAVYACLDKKYKRNDTARYMAQVSGLTESQVKCIHARYGRRALYWITEKIIDNIRKELIQRKVSFPEIWYREKIDGSSGKVRRIGIQNIKQQLYDYIAVEGLKPFLKRIGEYQFASIKGRGPLKGKQVISRWIQDKSIRYFVKLDVRKCFESIDHGKLMEFLKRHIKNDAILELIQMLINSFEKGLSIGSYLSQFLCNLYMSIVYHEIKENMYRIRRRKNTLTVRQNYVKRCLIYMDDILLLGTRKADLKKAVQLTISKTAEMGLEIKPHHQICHIDKFCIDMMGYKIYRSHTEIRGRVFLRVRRAFKKALRHKKIPLQLAKLCISRYGSIKSTNSRHITYKWKIRQTIKQCKGVIRNESKIRAAAAAC